MREKVCVRERVCVCRCVRENVRTLAHARAPRSYCWSLCTGVMAIYDLDNPPTAALAAAVQRSAGGGGGPNIVHDRGMVQLSTVTEGAEGKGSLGHGRLGHAENGSAQGGGRRGMPPGDACASCTAKFSSACPPIECDNCKRKQCYDCASETVVHPKTGQTAQVCDDCYFVLRDQHQSSGGGQGTGAARELPWSTERLMKLMPPHWRSNFGPLLSLASRTCMPRCIESARSLCTVAAAGHLGIPQLGAVALAKSLIFLSQAPLSSGLLAQVDAFISRILSGSQHRGERRAHPGATDAHQARDTHRSASVRERAAAREAGLWLQRGAVVLVCAAFFLALVWQGAYRLFQLLGLSAEMNEEAMVFLRVSILGILPELWLDLASIWMLAQGYEAPVNGAALVALPLHLVLTCMIVYGWGMGVSGAALACVLSRTAQLAIVGAHIYLQKLYERSWGGFSIDAFLPQPLYALVLASIPLTSAAGYLAALSQMPLLLAATLGPHALAAFVSLEYLSVIFVQVCVCGGGGYVGVGVWVYVWVYVHVYIHVYIHI